MLMYQNLTILKIFTCTINSCRLNTISIFEEIDKWLWILHGNAGRKSNHQKLEKKNISAIGFILWGIKTYFKVTVILKVCYGLNDRKVLWWNSRVLRIRLIHIQSPDLWQN